MKNLVVVQDARKIYLQNFFLHRKLSISIFIVKSNRKLGRNIILKIGIYRIYFQLFDFIYYQDLDSKIKIHDFPIEASCIFKELSIATLMKKINPVVLENF